MTQISKAIFSTLIIGAILFLGYSLSTARADANQLPSTIATTSNPTVGTTAAVLFATSTCSTRVITTSAQPIMITFSENQPNVPTGSFGAIQAASTTVTYDAGQFGCGTYKVYSFATQLLTVSESR